MRRSTSYRPQAVASSVRIMGPCASGTRPVLARLLKELTAASTLNREQRYGYSFSYTTMLPISRIAPAIRRKAKILRSVSGLK